MGRYYEMCQYLKEEVNSKFPDGKDKFHILGKIVMETGELVSLVSPDTPDDLAKIEKLKSAAKSVAGIILF